MVYEKLYICSPIYNDDSDEYVTEQNEYIAIDINTDDCHKSFRIKNDKDDFILVNPNYFPIKRTLVTIKNITFLGIIECNELIKYESYSVFGLKSIDGQLFYKIFDEFNRLYYYPAILFTNKEQYIDEDQKVSINEKYKDKLEQIENLMSKIKNINDNISIKNKMILNALSKTKTVDISKEVESSKKIESKIIDKLLISSFGLIVTSIVGNYINVVTLNIPMIYTITNTISILSIVLFVFSIISISKIHIHEGSNKETTTIPDINWKSIATDNILAKNEKIHLCIDKLKSRETVSSEMINYILNNLDIALSSLSIEDEKVIKDVEEALDNLYNFTNSLLEQSDIEEAKIKEAIYNNTVELLKRNSAIQNSIIETNNEVIEKINI